MGGNIPIPLNPLANDAAGDADGDQLSNLIEFQGGTNPQDADTDQDGFNDYAETLDGKDPTDRTSLPLPAPGVPQRMNYAGVVNVNGTPFNGTGLFKFAFIRADGSVLWTNDGTGGNGTSPPLRSVLPWSMAGTISPLGTRAYQYACLAKLCLYPKRCKVKGMV